VKKETVKKQSGAKPEEKEARRKPAKKPRRPVKPEESES